MDYRFFEMGIDHLNVPVYYRERLVGCEMEQSLEEIRRESGLDQLVLLATCSRFEIFAYSERPAQAREKICAWFERRGGAEIRPCLDVRSGLTMVEHLFRVSAGLESWILGESEILSQVKKAYQTAAAAGFTGPELNRLFQSAIAAGKSVRAKTGIQDGIHSIGGAAALLARRIFGEEKRGGIVVFGAGEAAQAVCRHLAAKNFGRIFVANRTRERADDLARSIGGESVSFEEGLRLLDELEVAVFSVSSSEPIVCEKWLRAKIAGRRRSLFLIDLGLPRNVASECASVPGVFVYDLDDLKNVVAQSMARKSGAKEEAEAIVRGAVDDCLRQFEKARIRATSPACAG